MEPTSGAATCAAPPMRLPSAVPTTPIVDRFWREVATGSSSMLPFVAGYAPFAIAIGAVAAETPAPVAGWAGSWTVFGGSAHLLLLRGVVSGTALSALVAALVVQSRLVVYSASLRAAWSNQPRWFRLLGAALLVDATFAAAQRRGGLPGTDRERRAHFLGAALTLGIGWSGCMAIGVLAGGAATALPVDLAVAAPLCAVVLASRSLRSREGRAVVFGAGLVAALLHAAPAGLGTLAAVGAGAAISARGRR
jgi:predicted branched-subunit amino acid permease